MGKKKKNTIIIVKVMILQKDVSKLTLESNSSAETPCLKKYNDEKFLVRQMNNMLVREKFTSSNQT